MTSEAPAGATEIIDHCKRLCRPPTRAEALTTAASPSRVCGTVGHNLSALTGLTKRRKDSIRPSQKIFPTDSPKIAAPLYKPLAIVPSIEG
jgi:hypothetical protein